jgi:hypothetical protein
MSIKKYSASRYLFNIFFQTLKYFLKFTIRKAIGFSVFKRDTNHINKIYERIRSERLKKLEKMTFDQFVFGESPLGWNLIDNKLNYGSRRVPHERKLFILEDLIFRNDSSVIIELGAGDGRNLLWLANIFPNYEFIGLELSQASVALAKAAAEKYQLTNVTFYQVDLTKTESYDYLLRSDTFVYSNHCLEEMPRIFKIPLEAIKNNKVKEIVLLEPAYMFSFSRFFLDIVKFLRIIPHDRLWGLISFCKKNMNTAYNIEIIDLGLAMNPVNPTTLIHFTKKG